MAESYNIGRAIGIPVEQLDEIENDHRDTFRQLIKMIAYQIINSELHTWRSLDSCKCGH